MRRSIQGFTTMELVVTIVLVTILAATAVVSWNRGSTTVTYQADKLARDIRHVQALAVAWEQPLRLEVSASGYTVTCTPSPPAQDPPKSPPCPSPDTDPITDPATNAPFVVTLQDATLSGTTTDFDSLGRPMSGGNLVGSQVTFTLTGDGNTATVTLEPLTGYAAVSY